MSQQDDSGGRLARVDLVPEGDIQVIRVTVEAAGFVFSETDFKPQGSVRDGIGAAYEKAYQFAVQWCGHTGAALADDAAEKVASLTGKGVANGLHAL